MQPSAGMSLRDFFAPHGWQVLAVKLRSRFNRRGLAEGAYRIVLRHRPRDRAALAGLGSLLLRERRFEEAIDVWRRAVDLEPERRGPAFQLARALHRSGRIEAAMTQYLRVLEIDPQHEKASLAVEQLTDRLVRSGWAASSALKATAAQAQQLAAEQLRSSRTRVNGLKLLARTQSKTDPELAIGSWTELIAMLPQSVEPSLQIARIHKRLGRDDEAQRFFRAVLDLDPTHAEALAGYGHALATHDCAAAIRHFTRWTETAPENPVPWLELARLHQQEQRWQEAETIYRDMLARIPNNPVALTRLAQLLSRDSARSELALDLWSRIAERDPTTPLPLVQRAYLFGRAKRPQEAEAEYRAALQRAPADAAALTGLARLLFGQARWSEAVTLYQALHAVNPVRIDALLGLGRCLERLDRGDDALAAYEKVLALDPGDANALLYRGRLLRQVGRIEEATEAWRLVCERQPTNADAWYELVFMLGSAERDAEALAALDAAETALPATAASWARLGLAAQAGQFHDRAVGYFRRAIEIEPLEPAHHTRLGQHYFRQGVVDGAFHHLLASRELKPGDVAVTRQLVGTVHILRTIGVDHMKLDASPHRSGDLLVPERLFQRVREVADSEVVAYEPVPGRVIAVTASLAAGGAERQLVNLLRGLSDPSFGLDLSLFCISLARRTRRDFFLPLLAETPVEIVTPPDDALAASLDQPHLAVHADLIRAFPGDMAGPIAFWTDQFLRRRPQVVHAWQDGTNLSTAAAALLAGVPRIVLAATIVRPDNPRRRLKRFMRDAYRAILDHPSVVLSNNSRAGANDYADWLDIDPAKVEVVYNGIDLEPVPSGIRDFRQAMGIPADAPIVGSAFRMSEEKRPLLWVEAAAEVARRETNAHFVVYGDGPMRPDMIELARRLGIGGRLHLPGPEDDMRSRYRAMDAVMLTSRHEGLPNVLLEAQSLGVPVVAPDVGGVAETVWQGVTGWAVRDADAGRLAEAVLRCLTDTGWAARARAEAPGFVQRRFGMSAMIRRTLEVYGLAPPPC